MKIENLLTAQRLAEQLKELDKALAELGKTDKFTKKLSWMGRVR